MSEPDRGYRDPDSSAAFEHFVATLDHFDTADYIRNARRIMYRLLRARPGMRVLDVGCGTGVDVSAMALKVGATGCLVGLDLSRRFLQVARERHGLRGIDFVHGGGQCLPFADMCFDATSSMRTLQYVAEPLTALRELARVTRPGGHVVVVEGGMSAVDLPESELTQYVFGPRRGFGVQLPILMREAGLVQIKVEAGFGFDLGKPDPTVLDYAQGMAANAAGEGVASALEASEWLQRLEAIVAEGRWFGAECLFVVCGTVAKTTE